MPSTQNTALTTRPPSRLVSGLERVWIAATRISPPFANQFLIELEGRPSLSALQSAVQNVAYANPELCMRRRYWGPLSRWVADGPLPDVRVVSLPKWDGSHGKNAASLQTPLDLRKGPIAHIWRLDGSDSERCHIIARLSHAVFDGRGTVHIVQELARAMRGETLIGSRVGPNDTTFARTLDPAPALDISTRYRSPFGALHSTAPSWPMFWQRRRFPVPRGKILAKTLVALLQASAPELEAKDLRVGIPVDLRRHDPSLHAINNLTGVVSLTLDHVLQGPDIARDVSQAIQTQIDASEHTSSIVHTDTLRWLPIRLITAIGRNEAAKEHACSYTQTSATISNLGLYNPRDFDMPSAPCTNMFCIPPGSIGLPLWLTLTGDGTHLNLCAATTPKYASEDQLTALMDSLQTSLQNPDLLHIQHA